MATAARSAIAVNNRCCDVSKRRLVHLDQANHLAGQRQRNTGDQVQSGQARPSGSTSTGGRSSGPPVSRRAAAAQLRLSARRSRRLAARCHDVELPRRFRDQRDGAPVGAQQLTGAAQHHVQHCRQVWRLGQRGADLDQARSTHAGAVGQSLKCRARWMATDT